MKFKNKQSKGWILEEIEKKKKDECLDANQFGGENPEDVEKQREKNDKEINKRFDGVRKTAKKVVGDDHEEHAKPHKVEEHYANRKDLGTVISKLKEQNIAYTVKRSPKEGFRYVLEYLTTEHKRKEEPLLEKIDLEEDDAKEGFISGAEDLSYDELANMEEDLWEKLRQDDISPRDGTFSNSSNRLADVELTMDIDGDWKHDHLLAEHIVEEWCKEHGYVIIKHTSEEIGEDTGRDDYEALHKWYLVKDTDGKMGDTVNTLHQMFTPADESLEESKKKFALVVNGEWYSTHNTREEAQKAQERFLDAINNDEDAQKEYGASANVEIKEIDESLKEGFNDKMKQFLKNNGYDVDKEDVETLEKKFQADWTKEYEEARKNGTFKDEKASIDALYSRVEKYLNEFKGLNEDLPDAIPEEPIVISTEPEPDVVIEEPTEEVKKTGLYNSLSAELRDTLQDIENLKSLTVTFVEEGREDLIDDLNAIIDERTVHSGMLQNLMVKVDGKVEAEETNTDEPIEEPEIKEESLNEEVDGEVEGNKEYGDADVNTMFGILNLASHKFGKKWTEEEAVERLKTHPYLKQFKIPEETIKAVAKSWVSKNESLEETKD